MEWKCVPFVGLLFKDYFKTILFLLTGGIEFTLLYYREK